MFPDVFDFIPQTWHSQGNICNNSCEKLHCSQGIAGCVEYISRKTIFNVNSHIDSVGCVMYVERNTRKKARNLESPLSITSQNFLERGFWIPIEGIKVKILPKGKLETKPSEGIYRNLYDFYNLVNESTQWWDPFLQPPVPCGRPVTHLGTGRGEKDCLVLCCKFFSVSVIIQILLIRNDWPQRFFLEQL